MKKEDAIKYIQQLYPNGGHCWLDEQRIEAIGMAIKALQEEPVSDIDFEQELYKAFGQVKDFTLGMRIAKWFYDMGKKNQEHVSEDLGEYTNELSKQFPEVSFAKLSRIAVRVAKWQREQDQSTIELAEDHAMLAGMEKMKEQMMKNAIDGYVIEDIEEGNGDFLLSAEYIPKSMGLKDRQKVKVIVIRED